MKEKSKVLELQWAERIILTSLFALLTFGLVFIFSTSSVHEADPTRFLRRQLLWSALGVLSLILLWHTDYRILRRYYFWIVVGTFAALLLVLVPGIGAKINGARRWIRLGGMGVQPSEFAKLALLIFSAAYASLRDVSQENWKQGALPAFLVIGLASFLILIEPDLGTATFVAFSASAVLLVAGAPIKPFLPYFVCFLPLLFLFAYWKFHHIQARLLVFLYPELDPLGKGHQVRQSLIALGSGGWMGVGLGNSRQKLFFLPEDHTDFIFAVLGEELGFLGALLVLFCILLILYAGRKIMLASKDSFGFYLSFGILFSYGLQSAMNIAVVTASMPTKGISLPLISFGGSSLVVTMMSFGILLSIGRETRRVMEKG